MTGVKRAKLVLQGPRGHLGRHPCSHRTRGCRENEGPKERRVIRECLGSRDRRAILETWGLGDLLGRRVPRDKKEHKGLPEQLATLVLLDLWAPPASAAPREVWALLASEAPLGKTGSAVRREQQGKTGTQGQLAPVGTPELQDSLGRLAKERTESRDSVAHLGYLDLWEQRETKEHLGSLDLPAAVATQASGLLALLALPDHQETKDPRDHEAYPDSPALRDQLARMVHQEIQGKEALLGSQAPPHACLQRT